MINFKEFGRRVKARRKQLGMTQMQLSEKIKRNGKFLSNIENGHAVPSLETLIALCIALETTPDYFLADLIGEQENDEEFLEFLGKYRIISETKGKKEYLKQVMDGIVTSDCFKDE